MGVARIAVALARSDPSWLLAPAGPNIRYGTSALWGGPACCLKDRWTMGDNDNVVVGIDQVRQRPGMWVGKTGLTGRQCLLWALVSNSVDQVA